MSGPKIPEKYRSEVSETNDRIADNVSYLMFMRGIKGKELAERTGYSHASIHRLRSHGNNYEVSQLVILARELGISLSLLVGRNLKEESSKLVEMAIKDEIIVKLDMKEKNNQ
jgi:transcriptional regulator with XRE-family HTH domain